MLVKLTHPVEGKITLIIAFAQMIRQPQDCAQIYYRMLTIKNVLKNGLRESRDTRTRQK